jgi:hypothetical protein
VVGSLTPPDLRVSTRAPLAREQRAQARDRLAATEREQAVSGAD